MPSISGARYPRAICNYRGGGNTILDYEPPLAYHVPPIARQGPAPMIDGLSKPKPKPYLVMPGEPHKMSQPGMAPQNGIVRINNGFRPRDLDYMEILEYGPRDTFVELTPHGHGPGVRVFECQYDGSVREMTLMYLDLPVVSLRQAVTLVSYYEDNPDTILCLWRMFGSTSLRSAVPERDGLTPYGESRTGKVLYLFVRNHKDALWQKLLANSRGTDPQCDYLEWAGDNPIPELAHRGRT